MSILPLFLTRSRRHAGSPEKILRAACDEACSGIQAAACVMPVAGMKTGRQRRSDPMPLLWSGAIYSNPISLPVNRCGGFEIRFMTDRVHQPDCKSKSGQRLAVAIRMPDLARRCACNLAVL
jgi:hypothetical protein